jgi:hypothetical protein
MARWKNPEMDGEYGWATGRILIQVEGKGMGTMADVVYTI